MSRLFLILSAIIVLVTVQASTALAQSAGAVRFNADWRIPEYYNGTLWVGMAEPRYVPKGIVFDGTNDWLSMSSTLTGAADGTSVTGSFWFRRTGGYGTEKVVFVANTTNTYTAGSTNRFQISFATDNRLQITGRSTSVPTTLRLDAKSSTQYTDSNWHHVMFSFNTATASARYIYIDGASNLNGTPTTHDGTQTINFNVATPRNSVGGRHTGNAAARFDGELADLWIDMGRFVDLSVASNRALFYKNTDKAVYLGATGTAPFGSAPEVYMMGAAATWQNNASGNGAFTVNGAITDTVNKPNGSTNIETGLVGHWKLDETSGTSIKDYSVTNNTGTMINMDGATDHVTGIKNNALDFDGTDDYVTFGNTSPGGLAQLTLSGWLKSSNTAEQHIIDKSGCSGTAFNGEFELFTGGFSAGKAGLLIYPASGSPAYVYSGAGTTTVTDGTWHHVVGVYDGSRVKIYSDGVLENSAVVGPVNTYYTTGSNLEIGGNCNGNPNRMNGQIDDVRIYNRALSNADVLALYNDKSCSNPSAPNGKIVYNVTQSVMQYCDSSVWRALGPVPGTGGSACTSPVRNAGTMIYNTSQNVMQYCDGAKWVRMGK